MNNQPIVESVIEEVNKEFDEMCAVGDFQMESLEDEDLSVYYDEEKIKCFIKSQISKAFEQGRNMKGSSWREGYERGIEEERKRCVEIVEKYIPKAEMSYKSAVSDQVAPYRHRLEELLEIKEAINTNDK